MTADDYFAIQRLINIYFAFVDEADFEAAGALFNRAEMFYLVTGRRIFNDGSAVAALMRSYVKLHGPDGRVMTRHHSGNIIIEPDGNDTATASCGAIIFQATPNLPLQPVAEALYRDRFAKLDGAWFFTHREMQMKLTGNLSEHLLRPA